MVNVVKQIIKISGTYPADVSSHDVTISPALTDLSKTIVFISFDYNATDDHSDTFRSWELVNTTTLRLHGEAGTATGNNELNFEATIIEFTSDSTVSIQHSDLSIGDSTTGEQTQTISSVTPAETSLFRRGQSHDVTETTIGAEELARVRLINSTSWGWLVDENPNTGPTQARVSVADWNDSSVLVQRGLVTMPSDTAQVIVSPSTSIDRTRTILQVSFATTNGDFSAETDASTLRATINASNQIVITREDNDAVDPLDIAWEVTQFPVNTIRTQYPSAISQTTGVFNSTTSITTINTLAHSTVISPVTTPFGDANGSCQTDTSANFDNATWSLTFDDVSTVRVIRGDADDDGLIEPMVIEWKVRQEEIFTIDARLAQREPFTVSAFLQDTAEKLFFLDAVLQATFEEAVETDAFLLMTQETTFNIDSLTMDERSKSFLIDGFKEDIFDETTDVDARLAQRESFNIDAFLSKVEPYEIDGRLIVRNTKDFIVDAKIVREIKTSVSAVLRLVNSEQFIIDSLIQELNKEKPFKIDSFLKIDKTTIFLIDASIQTVNTNTTTIDSRLRKQQQLLPEVNAIVFLEQITTFNIDTLLAKRQIFKIDSLLIRANQFKVDALPLKITDKTFLIDALPFTPPSKLFDIDSKLIVRNTEVFIVDSNIRKQQTKTFDIDSILKGKIIKTFLIDGFPVGENQETFLIDVILKATFNKNFKVDSLLQKEKTKIFTIDTFSELAIVKTFLIDGLLEITNTFDFTIDVFSLKSKQVVFTLDAILKATFSKTLKTDAIVFQVPSAIITIDSLLFITPKKTLKTDAVIKDIIIEEFTVDSRLRLIAQKQTNIDAILNAPKFLNFNTDALLFEEPKDEIFTTNALLKATLEKQFTIDGVTFKVPSAIITIDSLLLKIQEKVFVIDANPVIAGLKSFSIDAVLFRSGDVLCTGTGISFQDDISTSTGWSTTGTQILVDDPSFPDVIRMQCLQSRLNGGPQQAIKSLTIPANEKEIRENLVWEFSHDHEGNCLNFASDAEFALTATSTITSDVDQGALVYRIFHIGATSQARAEFRDSSGNTVITSAFDLGFFARPIIYVRISLVNNGNDLRFEAFDDPERTTHVSGSPFPDVSVSTVDVEPLNFIQVSNVGGGGSSRALLGEFDDILVQQSLCPRFLVDSVVKDLNVNKTFTVNAILVFESRFTIDAIIQRLGENCSLGLSFVDNINSSSGWVQTSTNNTIKIAETENPGVIFYDDWAFSLAKVYKLINNTISSNEDLKLGFKYKHVSIGSAPSNNGPVLMALGNSTNAVGSDERFAVIAKKSGATTFQMALQMSDTLSTTTTSTINIPNDTDVFVIAEKVGSSIRLNVYSDENRTIHLAGSPTPFVSVVSIGEIIFDRVATSPISNNFFITGFLDDVQVFSNICANFSIDVILSDIPTKQFTVDAIIEGKQEEFEVDALIKALGDIRCQPTFAENIQEDFFNSTFGWSPEINSTGLPWSTQRIFINGETISSEGKTEVVDMAGGGNTISQPFLKTKYRRKKIDVDGGVPVIRGRRIKLDLDITNQSFTNDIHSIRWLALNRSGQHPDNDTSGSQLSISLIDAISFNVLLRDRYMNEVNLVVPVDNVFGGNDVFFSIDINKNINTMIVRAYKDENRTILHSGNPVSINISSIKTSDLDWIWLISPSNSKSGPAENIGSGFLDNVKIFGNPCPVIKVDSKLKSAITNNFTIDANVLRISKFTIDAILRKVINNNFTVDAIVVRIKTFIVDTKITERKVRPFIIDPITLSIIEKDFNVDGLTFVLPVESILIDAILFEINTKDFDVDSILIKDKITENFIADAILTKTTDKTFTVSAVIIKTKIKTTKIDGIVKQFGKDGFCNFFPGTNFAIDTGFEQFAGPVQPEHEPDVDLLIGQQITLNNQQIRSVTLLLRASGFPDEITTNSIIAGKIWSNVSIGQEAGEITEATSENTIDAINTSGDLPPGSWKAIKFNFNRFTTPFLTGDFVAGIHHFVGASVDDPQGVGIAIPVISDSNVISGSAVFRRGSNSTIDPDTWGTLLDVSKDIVIRVEVVNGDEIIEGKGNQCPVMDALIGINIKEFTINAKIVNRNTKDFVTDVLLDPPKVVRPEIDGILVGTKLSLVIDSIIIPSPKQFTIDAIKLKVPGFVFNTDAIIIKRDVLKQFTIDTLLQKTKNAPLFNTNALLSVPNKTKTFIVDITTKFIDQVESFTVDSILIVVPSELNTIDAIIKSFNTPKLFTIDSLIQDDRKESMTVSGALLRKTTLGPVKIDSVLSINNQEKVFEVTASLANTQDPVLFSLDAQILLPNIRWRIDSLLQKKQVSLTFVDSILTEGNQSLLLSDGIIKDLNIEIQLNIDSILLKENQNTMIIDSVLLEPGITGLTIDGSTIGSQEKAINIDAKIVRELKINVDGVISIKNNKVFVVDAFTGNNENILVDSLLKATLSKDIFIDAKLVNRKTKTLSLDSKLIRSIDYIISAFVGEVIESELDVESVIVDNNGDVGIESTIGASE